MPKITPHQVRTAFSEVKNNKSPDDDGVLIEDVTQGGNKISPALAKLFTESYIKEQFLLNETRQSSFHYTRRLNIPKIITGPLAYYDAYITFSKKIIINGL